MPSEQCKNVIEKIDEFNSRDPNKTRVEDFEYSRELIYSKQLTSWVLKLNPDASDALRMAARGQHIGRWTIPRDIFPMDRGGYLRWREALKKFHAEKVTDFMNEEGCDAESIKAVENIILKKGLQDNPDTQTMEDALCLVFLETQFQNLKQKTEPEKMKLIVKKTWQKMSAKGKAEAGRLEMKPEDKKLIEDALG